MSLLRYILKESSTNNKSVKWEDLNDDVQMDIISAIYHESNHSDYLSSWNIWTFREYIDGATNLPKTFDIEYSDVKDLYKEFEDQHRETSDNQVNKLMVILKQGKELDPIIMLNNKFFDGGHRLEAYKNMGKQTIPTIDITKLFNINWEIWLEQ